jgi:deoxyribodipyrimidine photolyase-related protein
MAGWPARLGVPVEIREDGRFVCSIAAFKRWAKGRRELRMEWFYRDMRRRTGLLMEGDAPEGGQWNFDQDNRKPARAGLTFHKPIQVAPDAVTQDVLRLVNRCFVDHFGDLEPFWFAVTRADAERARDWFLDHALPRFGDYQDAMLKGERFLFHSILSPYINLGLLDPLDICRRVEARYRAGLAPLNAAEGFIRQIIGWREYVRGIYWLMADEGDYARWNTLTATRPLPAFYWTGDTAMACLREAVTQTREEAYAHHIQRLMITGNFALIAGLDPHAVHEWYLSVYADAYEWVEAPNTIGMSLHADGGVLASKPYAASANYIRKMSNYCDGCRYDAAMRTGPNACPFNFLYWDFIDRHAERFAKNPRMAFPVKTLSRFSAAEREAIRREAKTFLDGLEPADPGWTR